MMTTARFILTALVIVIVTLWGGITQNANARTSGGGYGWKAAGHQTSHPTSHPKSHHHN